jgi:single-stranded DNA-binding protein
MQVTLSGNTGRITRIATVDRLDGTGSFNVANTSLAVKVTNTESDWYNLNLKGDRLVNAASFITKGSPLSIVGTLSFKPWTDDEGILRNQAVIDVSDIQLAPKPKAEVV